MQEQKQNIEMITNGNTAYNQTLLSQNSDSSEFRRISLLANQLSANLTSNAYKLQNIGSIA